MRENNRNNQHSQERIEKRGNPLNEGIEKKSPSTELINDIKNDIKNAKDNK
ncbi:TPA: hypothetical protein PF714_002876 [Staphylococcus aureus]|uniref:Uncharacterized protein n=2 Tax=Staphylococcus aureus TaxID=1280 RepID=A0A380DKK8_STAAU|nr:hypothetical protein [Staphylococcus aureus]MBW5880602.1 hypothetical protein [Staphylococcus aureus]MBW5882577.1 hypothetical protein [Staphylococcus aureus]MDV0042387.1 hypothetical protein [Staphylococcus aureus]MDV0050304.1 hypothetical protein [Staphylococcus aureus]MDV0052937.1 hypothetical protein [Staphylococcus aureus]